MERVGSRLVCIVAFATVACASGASGRRAVDVPPAPSAAPARVAPALTEIDLQWRMLDWTQDPDCEDDALGYVHVDVASRRYAFTTCGGKKTVLARLLDERELAAVVELVSKVAIASAARPPEITDDCPRFRWRDASGAHESDWRPCERRSWDGDGAYALRDATEVLAAWRTDKWCGGPRARECPEGAACGSRDGLVPYAFGLCPSTSGGVSIQCMALAYCPRGWREVPDDRECEPPSKLACRWVSARCGDERLCAKCKPGEPCPSGDPAAD